MADEDPFAAYRRSKRPKNGRCRICGEAVGGRVVVTLQGRERVEGRTAKDANAIRFPAIDSTSASYCAAHAVEVYEVTKHGVISDGG